MNIVPRKFALATLGLALIALLGGLIGWGYFLNWADSPINAKNAVVAELQRGMSLREFNSVLAKQNYVISPTKLALLARIEGSDRRIQAGEYAFDTSLTPRQLLEQLNRGEVITYSFRIAEGQTVSQILKQLRAAKHLDHLLTSTDSQALSGELTLAYPSAEGAFFPDTYQYRRGESDITVLMRAHTIMQQALEQVWHTRSSDNLLTNPFELLTLASIVEKETGLASDRGQISQVFHKRLADNMMLQTDPTVIYALGDTFDGNLTRKHLRMASVYNTYRNRGLPPTPIATPSLASLEAAANPAEGDFVYFVARGDGSSQFSQTLAQHNAAVRRYQLGRKDK